MRRYFIWYKLEGDVPDHVKSQRSSNIHTLIFARGKKLHAKSNSFIFKSSATADQIVDTISGVANGQIKLFVIEINGNYQGWLPQGDWDFINK